MRVSLQSATSVNPLVLPPKLLLRALDDLHTIATAAARLEEVEQRLDARLAAVLELGDRVEQLGHLVDQRIGQVDARAGELLELGDRVDGRAEGIVAMGDRVDARAGELLGVAGDVSGRLDGLLVLGERIDEILEQGRRVEQVARDVADRGGAIADALPILQRAVEMAVPLEGAVERLGRIVDRLPTVPQRRTRTAAPAKAKAKRPPA
jgi:hypothetical protein